MAIVFNGIRPRGFGKHHYGYGYGYGSGYGYYEEETPRGSFLDRLLNALDIKKVIGKKN